MAFTKSLALAGAITIAAGAASAASILDLTAAGAQNAGMLGGATYGISAVGGALNNSEAYDGGARPSGAIADMLAFERDGYGVTDDEITYPGERIVITFDRMVRLTGVAFLDLFNDANVHNGDEGQIVNEDGTSDEYVRLIVDGTAATVFDSVCPYRTCGGYAEYAGLELMGRVFSFEAGDSPRTRNDGVGKPDFALAALEVAAVPVPAAGVLLLGALGGLAAARRRKG